MKAENTKKGSGQKKSEVTILREAYQDSTSDDLNIVEGIDSVTGKSFVADFVKLRDKKDTIREATERSNK